MELRKAGIEQKGDRSDQSLYTFRPFRFLSLMHHFPSILKSLLNGRISPIFLIFNLFNSSAPRQFPNDSYMLGKELFQEFPTRHLEIGKIKSGRHRASDNGVSLS